MSWKDREFERQDARIFPFIQWVNAGGNLDPRRDVGGFGMPVEQSKILGAQISPVLAKLYHGPAYTEIHFADRLELAVLTTRFAWLDQDKQMLPKYQPGARSKLQALCLVRDINKVTVGPVIVTLSGMTSKFFGEALRQHRAQVQGCTGGKAPAYAFFGVFGAAGTEMVGSGQQSQVTKLAYSRHDLDPDAAYVGGEALDALDWDVIDEWAAAWKTEEPAEIPMITGSQRTFLGRLLVERGMNENDLECPAEAMTRAMASEAIEKIKALPRLEPTQPRRDEDIVGGKDLMDEIEALGGVDRSGVVGPQKWGWVYQTTLDQMGWDRATTIAKLKELYGDVSGLTVGQVLDAMTAPQVQPEPPEEPFDIVTPPPEPDLGWDEEIPF